MKNPVSHESLKRTRDTRLIFSSWTLLDSFLIIMDASLLLRRDLIRQTVSALLCSLILFCRKWSLEEMRSLSRFFLSLSFFQKRIRKGEWMLFTTTVVVLRTRKETMNKMYTQMQRRNLRSDCDVKGQTGRRREWMRGPKMIKGSWRFGVLSLKALSPLELYSTTTSGLEFDTMLFSRKWKGKERPFKVTPKFSRCQGWGPKGKDIDNWRVLVLEVNLRTLNYREWELKGKTCKLLLFHSLWYKKKSSPWTSRHKTFSLSSFKQSKMNERKKGKKKGFPGRTSDMQMQRESYFLSFKYPALEIMQQTSWMSWIIIMARESLLLFERWSRW